jgi:hypothetical protein
LGGDTEVLLDMYFVVYSTFGAHILVALSNQEPMIHALMKYGGSGTPPT